MTKYLWIVLMGITLQLSAQQTANQVLAEITRKFSKVRDYSAEVRIISDIPFLKVLPVSAAIYFKQKDKFTQRQRGLHTYDALACFVRLCKKAPPEDL